MAGLGKIESACKALLKRLGVLDPDGTYSGGLSGLGSTDNAVVRTDGTGGDRVQGSSVTISDTGTVSWPTGLGPIPHVQGPSDQSLIINSNSGAVIFQSSGSHRLAVSGGGVTAYTSLVPATDGNRDLGASSTRWGSVYAAGFVQVGAYTVATLPPATTAGRIIYVSNGAAGSPCLAFSDGTNWLRVDTLTAVSDE